jgi:gamma-glutamylcyclotransferase (GGCT)/AIG2-like uncharacterized protein YtfP
MRELPLFVYGSLLVPSVRERFLEREVTSLAATLQGYERRSFGDGTYPAIRVQAASRVEGQILCALSKSDLWRLDEYEGLEYERHPVEVTLRATGATRKAQAYVVAPAYEKQLLAEDWSLQRYAASLRSSSG